jgi:Flp pilus assembly protein TadD
MMRIATILAVAGLLQACASAPDVPRPEVLNDSRFGPPSQRVDRADIFALSDQMLQFLRSEVAAEVRDKGPARGLFDALSFRGRLRLDYDATTTHSASQAFAEKSGNCLSLVLMTAAFAKALEIPVGFQSVHVDDTWGRTADVELFIGHVNVTLGRNISEVGTGTNRPRSLTIDFLPARLAHNLPSRRIPEDAIVAMYMNNRAVENLTQGRLDDAYWWARGAVLAYPGFVSAYNTLGVVYRRHGDLAAARAALEHALSRDQDNPRVMSNLAAVLDDLGRAAEAEPLRRKLARIEPEPPFADFNRGLAAMRSEDYRLARDFFAREIRRDPFYHEFRYWYALSSLRLGNFDEARANLEFAREFANTRKESELYRAKLDRLKARTPM